MHGCSSRAHFVKLLSSMHLLPQEQQPDAVLVEDYHLDLGTRGAKGQGSVFEKAIAVGARFRVDWPLVLAHFACHVVCNACIACMSLPLIEIATNAGQAHMNVAFGGDMI